MTNTEHLWRLVSNSAGSGSSCLHEMKESPEDSKSDPLQSVDLISEQTGGQSDLLLFLFSPFCASLCELCEDDHEPERLLFSAVSSVW